MVKIDKKFILAGFILVFAVLLVQGVSGAVNLISPPNNTWVNNGTNPTFVYNHTLAGAPVNCTVNVAGIGVVNFTFNVTANTTTAVISNTTLEGIYNWNVTCTNSTGYSETSNNWILKNDYTNPTITSFAVSPNVSISQYNLVTISADVSDTNLDYVDIGIIDTNNLIGSNQTIFLGQYNESGDNSTYSFEWPAMYVNITNGATNELITAYVDTTGATPPTMVMVFGYFQKNATEPVQSDCTLIFNASEQPPLTLLSVYNRTVDLGGQIENGTSNFTVISYRFVDWPSGPPVEVNGSTFILYNISASNELNPYLNISLVPSGNYAVDLVAMDDVSNVNAEFANITVDNDAPIINLETPVDTANLSTSNVNLTFNVTDNLTATLNCSLYINSTWNDTNSSVSEGTSTTFTITFADGSYSWYINCSDDAGNINVSSTSTFSVDATAPSVIITSPSDNSWHKANFTINATVTGATTVTYRWENSTYNNNWINMGNLSGNSWNATFDLFQLFNGNLTEGNFTIRINATDISGNSNTTETILVWKDITDPTITSFTLSDTSVYKGDDITPSCSATDNLDTSVDTTISGLDTSSTGTFTATCKATDNARNSVTSSSIEYTVRSKGTTGAGTYTPPPPSQAQIWNEIEAGATVHMSITKTEIGFTKLSIDVKNKANDVEIKVTKLATKPATVVHEIKGKVYQYVEVDKTNIKDEDISKAVIEFRVEKSWLTANNIAENHIAINRYTTTWEELSTEKISSDFSYVYYKATTTGFSYFAISEEEAAIEEVVEEVVEGVEEVPPAEDEVVGEVLEEKAKIKTGWIIAIIVIISLVVYLVWPKKR